MTDLTAKKLEEEVRLLQAERRSTQARLLLDSTKTVVLFIGAIIVFFAVQRPGSILSRKETEDSIRRERAGLLLEWIKEEDLSKRRQALAIIRAAYMGSTDEWLELAEYVLLQGSEIESTLERYGDSEKISKLLERKQELVDRLAMEISGVEGSGRVGYGPIARKIQEQIKVLDQEIEALKSTLPKQSQDDGASS